eukprot:m.7527 g.7527  ORF g.7527 m.7527 type:complete len:183 (-) comp2822_c0_seq2:142-690(-)
MSKLLGEHQRKLQAKEFGVSPLRSRTCEACKFKYEKGLGSDEHNTISRKGRREKGLLAHDTQCHEGIKRCGSVFAYFKERSAAAKSLCFRSFDNDAECICKHQTSSSMKPRPHERKLTTAHAHALEQTTRESVSFGHNYHYSLAKYKYVIPDSVGNRHRVTMHSGLRDMYKSMYLDELSSME